MNSATFIAVMAACMASTRTSGEVSPWVAAVSLAIPLIIGVIALFIINRM